MALLCACKESSTVNTYQPPINVITSVTNEESAVKNTKTQKSTKTTQKTNANKTTTTTVPTTTAPKSTNSAIKSLLIDGNGNLVSTNANGTFSVVGQVQGAKGDKGDKGEQGSQGEKGEAGRGIESCNVNSDGDLIITYTDGSTQNAGNVRQEVIVHDYEQVGYRVPSDFGTSTSGHTNSANGDYDYQISNLTVTLIAKNDDPRIKFKYRISFDYSISNIASIETIEAFRLGFGGIDVYNSPTNIYQGVILKTDLNSHIDYEFTKEYALKSIDGCGASCMF